MIRWWDWLKTTEFLLLPRDRKDDCVHTGQVPAAARGDTSPQVLRTHVENGPSVYNLHHL